MKTIFLGLLSLLPLAFVHAETIDLTDKKGRSITAVLKSFDGKTVDFIRKSDSRSFSLPVGNLSPETTEALIHWKKKGGGLATDFEVSVNTGKTSKTTGAEDFDDKRVNLSPTVTVENTDSTSESRPLQLTVVFLGRPVAQRSDIHVFSAKTFELPSLQPFDSKDFTLDKISEPYDDKAYAQFGRTYLGYAWLIHDKAKKAEDIKIFSSGSIPSVLAEKYGRLFLSAKAKSTYDRDMKLKY